ncbi:hypothetical protein [Lysinibacillus sp. 54212]|uniref:hypothetical protein n=1 Tax=Lysinibacillus sp. 54212 TaxID=3119829 RepID=UPI002FCB212F
MQDSQLENQVFNALYEHIHANAANSQELLSMIDEVSSSMERLNVLLANVSNSTQKLENIF